MSQVNGLPAPDTQQRLESVLAAYLEDEARGKLPNRKQLLDAYPDLANELRQFLEDHDKFKEVSGAWRSEMGIETAGPDISMRSRSEHDDPPKDDGAMLSQLRSKVLTAAHSPMVELGRFGDYELLREVARGGMGVVYQARQLSLDRIVAIKMILQSQLAASDDVERFVLEAKAVAKLAHPHIVVIHDVGRCDDQHYFSMEYIEGQSLAALIRQGPIPDRTAAKYVEEVARAVHFAHQHGIVHRDLKPSNILIDERGRARVTDFGLAKGVDRRQELTLTGQIVGTPAYMAPEQITNRRGEIGPLCDVYGLGALLYELLTGRPPVQGRNQVDTLLQVLECEPPSPRQLNPNVPRELEMICLKCLEKDPRRRYPSACDVAVDLAHFLAGESISLGSPKLMDRVVRTLERSHYDREFKAWSRIMLHLAWISFVTHALVFFNHKYDLTHRIDGLIGIRVLEVVGMGVVLWILRHCWYPPRGAPARQILALWLGYMVGSLTLVAVMYLLTPPRATFNDSLVYPPLAVVASHQFCKC